MKAGEFFDFLPFHFETVRVMWYAPAGGADYGEVMSAVRRIKSGDVDSWYAGWSALAQRLSDMADGHVDRISMGNALLRASNYMRTAEFFLPPRAAQRERSSRFAQDQFYRGLTALQIPFERLRLPYEDVEMEAIYLPAEGADTLFVVHGGFDSTPEELFFMFGRGAQLRGCDVLIYEGPGQGFLLRKHGLPFDPRWEKATGVALEAALAKRTYKHVVGIGISMGGHFLARAAAKEKRLDAIVLCDYFPAPIEAFKHGVPAFMRKGFVKKSNWVMRLIARRAQTDVHLNWAINQGKWTFGAQTLPELIERMMAFDEGAWVENIEAHVLAMVGEQEHFFDKSLADAFVARLTRARSVTLRTFSSAEGGELHCRNGAYYLLHDSIFQWLGQWTGSKAAVPAGAGAPRLRKVAG